MPELIPAAPGTPAPVIYINGIEYPRCGSTYFYKRCADTDGHDGKHHNSYLYWMNSEAHDA